MHASRRVRSDDPSPNTIENRRTGRHGVMTKYHADGLPRCRYRLGSSATGRLRDRPAGPILPPASALSPAGTSQSQGWPPDEDAPRQPTENRRRRGHRQMPRATPIPGPARIRQAETCGRRNGQAILRPIPEPSGARAPYFPLRSAANGPTGCVLRHIVCIPISLLTRPESMIRGQEQSATGTRQPAPNRHGGRSAVCHSAAGGHADKRRSPIRPARDWHDAVQVSRSWHLLKASHIAGRPAPAAPLAKSIDCSARGFAAELPCFERVPVRPRNRRPSLPD